MSIMLTWLADELRAAGLQVREHPGWQDRRRDGGPYTALPLCVMEHHTASPPSWDGQRDADYCATGDPVAPLANLYIDRSGLVWVLAAGPTNTNGKGNAMTFSRGTVPADGMNTRAVGIECGNNGTGEAWPEVQVNALIAAANAVNRRLGNQPTDIAGHAHYAPGRKIDPAVAGAVRGVWRPRPTNSSGTWDLDDMRAEHARRATSAPPSPGPTPPPIEEDEAMLRAAKSKDTGTWVLGNGSTASTMDGVDATEAALRVAGGVIDVGTQKVVYSWSKVTAIESGDVRKYVGSY